MDNVAFILMFQDLKKYFGIHYDLPYVTVEIIIMILNRLNQTKRTLNLRKATSILKKLLLNDYLSDQKMDGFYY